MVEIDFDVLFSVAIYSCSIETNVQKINTNFAIVIELREIDSNDNSADIPT